MTHPSDPTLGSRIVSVDITFLVRQTLAATNADAVTPGITDIAQDTASVDRSYSREAG